MTKDKATAPLRDAMLAKVVKERNAALAEVARLREALGDILQCFENGAMPHVSIIERARAALSSEKE